MNIPAQILALVRRLRLDIQGIQIAIQEHIAAIKQAHKGSQQGKEPPLRIIAEIDLPEGIVGAYTAQEKKNYHLQVWNARGVWATCLVVLFGSCVALWTLNTMKRQLSDSEAAQGAQLSIENFAVDGLPDHPVEHYAIFNGGQTFANDVQISQGAGGGTPSYRTPTLNEPLPDLGWVGESNKNMFENYRHSSGGGFSLPPNHRREYSFNLGPLSQDVLDGKQFSAYSVFVGYTSVFGQKRYVADYLCYRFAGKTFSECPRSP